METEKAVALPEELRELINQAQKSGREKPGKRFYIYLHTNGNLIMKSAVAVEADESYFDSPFVKQVWRIETWEDVEKFAVEVIGSSANLEDIINLFSLRRKS